MQSPSAAAAARGGPNSRAQGTHCVEICAAAGAAARPRVESRSTAGQRLRPGRQWQLQGVCQRANDGRPGRKASTWQAD
eukprot:365508-Chlamydomonas_euryale.AAC.9